MGKPRVRRAIGGVTFALMVTEINWPVIVMITGVFAIVQCFCGIVMKEPRIMKERLANGGDIQEPRQET